MPKRIYDRREFGTAGAHLSGDIRKGLFTPFLGAGASSLWPRPIDLGVSPWKEVMWTLSAIRAQLDAPKSIGFLRSLASQRLDLPEGVLDPYIPADVAEQPEVPAELEESGLVRLQAQLVEATIRLTLYFGEKFAQEAPSITSIRESYVLIDITEKKGKDAIDYLFRVADTALALHQARIKGHSATESPYVEKIPGVRRTLAMQRIYEKLLTLIRFLAGPDDTKHEEKFQPHSEYIATHDFDAIEPSAAGKLRLDAVQWMSDLIWYTLRYWIPRYPSSTDLAFELSLKAQYTPVRRGELAQAAQALENLDRVQLGRELRELLRYCEKAKRGQEAKGPGSVAFYYAVAAALYYQFCSYSPSEDPLEPYRGGGTNGNGGAFPIVFTTNYDRLLEKVFAEEDIAYHVVFPVRVGREEGKEKIVWNFSTRGSTADNRRIRDKKWGEVCDGSETPNLSEWKGPLVVKLHGSPTEEKPEYAEDHWIVLSEVNYLQALGNEQRMPKWLSDQMTACLGSDPKNPEHARSLWFLGYSIADWNVRLRLWEHCEDAAGVRSTVGREEDAYRCAILGNLNVAHYCGDLHELPRFVVTALDDEALGVPGKVKRLVDTVVEHIGGWR